MPKLKEQKRTKKLIVPQTPFTESHLFGADEFGWLIDVSKSKPNAASWLAQNKALINTRLNEKGAVLIRGTAFDGIPDFDDFICEVGEKLSYEYRSTPRSELKGRVYTSTNYPASEWIPLHNENAYSAVYPNKVIFGCQQAPETGGSTTLADSNRIFELLPEQVREKFQRFGVKYVRNMGMGFDLHWHEVFQTQDKDKVAQICSAMGINFTWNGEMLRTEQTLPAAKIHPVSKLNIWFNQAHLFHYSSIPQDIAEELISAFGEEALPRNAYYGDGSPLEVDVLDTINQTYEQCLKAFPWQKGDLLVVDNLRVAHGRQPFTGERTILTGMTL
nr:TauD/TfdA family dioxygenase [Pseudoalteromonas sp. OOF1S-7]